MRNILIVGKLISVVDDFSTLQGLDLLDTNDIVAIGDGKKVLGKDSVVTDFNSIATLTFTTKFSTGDLHSTVSIPRKLLRYNFQAYSAPQNKVIALGGTSSTNALDIPTEGEGIVVVKNLSYNHAISTQKVIASVMKKPSQTPEQYVDALVLKLNNTVASQATPFFTAAKVGGGTANLGIIFTTIDEHVDLFVGSDGFLAGAANRVTTQAKCATGKGVDIVQMEKDMSRHQGNQGYVQNTDLWYKQPVQASASTNYDIFTLEWDGIAPSPTVNKNVAINSLSIAIPTSTSAVDNFKAFMALLLGEAYTPVGGVETGNEPDENAIDETPQ